MSARNPIRTLLIEEIPSDAHLITGYLTGSAWRPFSVKHVSSVDDAVKAMQTEFFDAVIVDLSLAEPNDLSGIAKLRSGAPHLACVVLTGPANESLGIRAVQNGAQEYLPRQELSAGLLTRTLANAVERHRIVWHLREVIARAADAMVVVDKTGHVQLVNRAATSMFQGEAEALLGKGLGFELKAGIVREMRLPQKDAEPILAEMRVVEITWNGQPANLCCLREIGRYAKMARDLKVENERLQALVENDTFAQVLNRKGLERALANESERMRRSGSNLAAVLVFCDDYRKVDDASKREEILQRTASSIAEITRPCDHVGRLTDDSFLILLPDTRIAEAVVVGERLRDGMSRATTEGQASPSRIGVSIGVGAAPNAATNLRDLFTLCKDALMAGRPDVQSLMWNATPIPDQPHESARMPAVSSESPLRAVPQMIMSVADEKPIGCEFLIRGPKGPLENPVALFGAAIDAAALVQLDLQCLRTCVEASRSFPANWRYHFNIFPATIAAIPVEELALLLRSTGRPVTLCVEISEQRLVGDPQHLAARLEPFRKAGIEIAIDDLGFGRSSLEVLLVADPKVVKVERRYVTGVAGDREQARLLRRFLTLVHGVGALAIAEGVETREDLVVLREMGVEYAQGFLWGQLT